MIGQVYEVVNFYNVNTRMFTVEVYNNGNLLGQLHWDMLSSGFTGGVSTDTMSLLATPAEEPVVEKKTQAKAAAADGFTYGAVIGASAASMVAVAFFMCKGKNNNVDDFQRV